MFSAKYTPYADRIDLASNPDPVSYARHPVHAQTQYMNFRRATLLTMINLIG